MTAGVEAQDPEPSQEEKGNTVGPFMFDFAPAIIGFCAPFVAYAVYVTLVRVFFS